MGARVYTTPLAGAFTNLGITNAFSMGGGGNNNAKYDYTTYQIADDFDMVRGSHQITFGVDFLHQVMSVSHEIVSAGLARLTCRRSNTPTPTPQGCSDILVNGDFESDAAWIFGDSPVPGKYTGALKQNGQLFEETYGQPVLLRMVRK